MTVWRYLGILLYVGWSVPSLATEDASMDMVRHIQERYYLIRRLEQPIGTLMDAMTRIPFTQKAKGYFKHPVLYRTIATMENAQSAEPFYKVWGDFLSYKFVESKEFVREVLTALLLMYKELILHIQPKAADSKKVISIIDSHLVAAREIPVDESVLLSTMSSVHTYYKGLQNPKDFYELSSILTGHHTLANIREDDGSATSSIEGSVGTIANLLDECPECDLVVANNMRFYHIQRILKSIFVLSRSHIEVPVLFEQGVIDSCRCLRVRQCLETINTKKSVEPLFDMWKEFTSYAFISDDTSLREFLISTILVYKHLIQNMQEQEQRGLTSPKEMLAAYERIASLPIPELLNLLDDVVEHYDALSEQYGLRDTTLTWSAWFTRYWWAPPLIAGSFGFMLFKHRQAIMFLMSLRGYFKNNSLVA